ncbi:nitrous oxidase accessory protein [Hyphomicrobium denitrificans 1NES1]|uniref:Nitrous oxidase accessory protein n=1 Tax=Hyphomicrobium denitrificans 1NES1 TaxID=670307 RepID=N0B5X9_9HYPH|nr:TIGR03808 family TAT-translocated repetitive protein [Hyphomicrobium denitrificans]AGK58959.1 nitrous oxidase accessory protein [Hyphomicrobium denitrificans 1NES1]
MTINRRSLIGASLGLGAAVSAAHASERRPTREPATPNASEFSATLIPDERQDQTAALQAAVDAAAERDIPLVLPPGKFIISDLRLRRGTRLLGSARSTILVFSGGTAFVTAEKADGLMLAGLTFDGAYKTFDPARGDGLLALLNSKNVHLADLEIQNSAGTGLSLTECGGRIEGVLISHVLDAGFKSLDSFGLDITGNTVTECGNNGILIWRSKQEEDGSVVSGNRISKIRNAAGGTGEYGNGINVFRAGSVLVSGNRISDCAYTAVRGNASSNIQIIGNSCERLGEVALYAEFGFQGAIIANNLVDTAACGISVTNFNDGGRLAVVQGNLIRNLFRREQEPEDKRGEGIGVEADAVVTGNTIENAPTVGIQIGWGAYMRDVAVTGNIVRDARVGISVTNALDAGKCLIANNLISNVKDGAIREMDLGAFKGPDLVREPSATDRIHITANVAV